MARASIGSRLGAALLGTLAAILLLEMGLRLVGDGFAVLQALRDPDASEEEDATRDRSVEALLILAEIDEVRGLFADAEHLMREVCLKAEDCSSLESLVGFLAARGRRAEAHALIVSHTRQQRSPMPPACYQMLDHLVAKGDFYGSATPLLRDSYARLYDLLAARGMSLVAVQYPTLPVEPLRRVLPADPRIRVVDDEAVFKAAVRREGFAALFTDRGCGTFGHGTARANRILAERVADAILAAPDD